jgi:hypothetical protein
MALTEPNKYKQGLFRVCACGIQCGNAPVTFRGASIRGRHVEATNVQTYHGRG